MEWTILISPIVSAIIAAFGAYTATKRAAEDRERMLEAQMNERDIELKTELAAISTEMKLLSERVEKHNHMVERTYRLEADVANLFHRYDELKGDIKIGGTE